MATTEWLKAQMRRLGYDEPTIEASAKRVDVRANHGGMGFDFSERPGAGKGDWAARILNKARDQAPRKK